MIRHSLFTFSFKKNSKILIQVIAFFCIFLVCIQCMNYLYRPEKNDWTRILWHNFYKLEENIDCLYLGSSHVYCDINPDILDEKNGMNNFNLATSGQPLNNSYYLLKEAVRLNDIKQVYLEMYYFCSTGTDGDYTSQEAASWGWPNTDYMKLSMNKIDAFFHFYSKEYYMDALFPFIRYREHLGENDWIKCVTDDKKTENYKDYICNIYSNKGFGYSDQELTNFWGSRDRTPEQMYITKDAEYYLRKIIQFCQKKGITLTLFSSPVYELQLISIGDYDNYVNGVRSIAGEYGIEYYDFNLAKEEFFPIQDPTLFRDKQHLNTKGAETFTVFFYQVVSGQIDENQKYFYRSYREKQEYSEPAVYGFYTRNAEKEELLEGETNGNTARVVVASNSEELEYKIYYTPKEGTAVLLQDFSNNKEFNIQLEDHGTYQIIWCKKGDYKNTHCLQGEY